MEEGKAAKPRSEFEIICIGVVFLFHLAYSVGFFEAVGIFLNPIRARAISVGLILLLAFIMHSPTKNKLLAGAYKGFTILATLVTMAYIVFGYYRFEYRIGSAVGYEVILGILTIIVVLESTRVTAGKEIAIIAIVLIFYSFFGKYLSGFFQAPPTSITLISGQMYMGLIGVYGIPAGIVLDYVFGFVLFGFVLEAVGGIRFFVDLALRVFRGSRGASTKIAIATNQLFGLVSGSTISNVLVTGPIAIPEMRKEGYSERFMGGLIAAAADAAQLDPPVMGMVAFFMAEYLRISYIKVCVAAILPSFFYYFSLYSFTHLVAVRKGIRSSPPSEEHMPPLWKLLIKQWHVIASCTFLVMMMATEATTVRQALMISTGLLLITGFLRKDTRPTFKTLRYSVVQTAESMVAMAPVCAAAGIILGCFSMTGLDYKFTAEITDIAGQSMLLLLLLASVASFILGTGMPTLPAYILVVLTVSPTLISMGIPPLVVHMFIFYQCLTAMLTLPAGLNVYAVAPMVKCSIWQIGISAIGIGAARYIIPFFFIYRPGLLIIGANWVDVIVDTLLCFIVIMAISFTQARYALTNSKWLEIFAALIGSLFLFYPFGNLPIPSQIIGAVLVGLVIISQVVRFFIFRARSLTNYNEISLKS